MDLEKILLRVPYLEMQLNIKENPLFSIFVIQE